MNSAVALVILAAVLVAIFSVLAIGGGPPSNDPMGPGAGGAL